MDSNVQTDAALFQRRPGNRGKPHDVEDESQTSSPNETPDLEKADTIEDARDGTTSGACRVSSSNRVSRIQSLQRKQIQFDHPLSHVQTNADVIVDFDGPDDPYRPLNWPFTKKVITTALYGFTTMGSTWASSVYSPAVDQISKQYHVGTEVSLLGLSVFLCGFGLGPLFWAPISECYGRKPAVLLPYVSNHRGSRCLRPWY